MKEIDIKIKEEEIEGFKVFSMFKFIDERDIFD